MDTITQEKNRTEKRKPPLRPILLAAAALVVCIALFCAFLLVKPAEASQEIVTISTLENIIQVSELSTFTAVYNGVAQVHNEKKTENIDYYVSYEAKVNAGINFEQLVISMDSENKIIQIALPEIQITDVVVDISSLDFIFLNDKANTSTVSQQAFKACEIDAKEESQTQEAIYDLAKQNAKNILKALVQPIVDQLEAGYSLEIE